MPNPGYLKILENLTWLMIWGTALLAYHTGTINKIVFFKELRRQDAENNSVSPFVKEISLYINPLKETFFQGKA